MKSGNGVRSGAFGAGLVSDFVLRKHCRPLDTYRTAAISYYLAEFPPEP